MNKSFYFMLALAGVLLLSGCESSIQENVKSVNKTLLTGKVQKGPFIIGSTVDIFELNGDYAQTGRNFATVVSDKDGSFQQRNLSLVSQFVEIRSNGYYFNEVKGGISESPLTLYALADVSDADNVNVNILTTLERGRIYSLLAEGMSFRNAKKQAHNEVLALFGMKSSEISDAVELNIEGDAQLLVISSIVLGYRSSAQITELITSIASDLSDNGKLDNLQLASELKNNALGVKAHTVVENMKDYNISFSYNETDVEYWIKNFIDNMPYEQTEFVEYPDQALGEVNILSGKNEHLSADRFLALAANTPAWGSLKIEISAKNVDNDEYFDVYWAFQLMPVAPKNWTIGKPLKDSSTAHQTITVTNPGEPSEMLFIANVRGELTFTFYENSDTPTREETYFFE